MAAVRCSVGRVKLRTNQQHNGPGGLTHVCRARVCMVPDTRAPARVVECCAKRKKVKNIELGFSSGKTDEEIDEILKQPSALSAKLEQILFNDIYTPDPNEPMKIAFELKFLWTDQSLAIALNQTTKKGVAPVSEYFFWPRKDAWDEMSNMLNSKAYIPEEEKIAILNTCTEVINFWQDSETKHSIDEAREAFPTCVFHGS